MSPRLGPVVRHGYSDRSPSAAMPLWAVSVVDLESAAGGPPLSFHDYSVIIEAMSAEEDSDLDRRAAIHGALSDVSRLRVVDALILGDASPSDLARLTGLSSNLLAHHLSVLEAQGLIRRRRSDGDRRRSYVHLLAAQLPSIGVATAPIPARILFVCTANSARSQLAAALWRRASRVPAVSAGTHPADRVDPRAINAAERHRLTMRRVRPQHLDRVRHDGDLVVSVCDSAHEELEGEGLADSHIHWSVPDPVRVDTDEAFESALVEINGRVQRLATAIPVP
jgi:protein-tyrosine-phosphatase/DNA-binding MarR family transcriptional regulator